jgi:excisionase family DNA binding protein
VTIEVVERPALLTVGEAATALRVSRSKAYELAAAGQLPGLLRVGRSLRVSRRALDAWIDTQAASGALE